MERSVLFFKTPATLSSMPADQSSRSMKLYAILSSILKHRPKAILREVENRCGFETWRRLNNAYAPKTRARSMAVLTALMQTPHFTKDKTMRKQIQNMERVAAELCQDQRPACRSGCDARHSHKGAASAGETACATFAHREFQLCVCS